MAGTLAVVVLAMLAISPTDLLERKDELLAKYRQWDAQFRDGIGYSDRDTSGGLAWAEARFLRNYMLCYEVSKDTYWLDKIVDHFERMKAKLADPDGDGFLAWSDIVYSVGIGRVVAAERADGLKLEPKEQRVYYRRGGKLITGHTYKIRFVTNNKIAIENATTGKRLAEKPVSYTHLTLPTN